MVAMSYKFPFLSQLENMNVVTDTMSGVARASYSPRANMTALLTAQGVYYVGTLTDFSGVDPAIVRISLESEYAAQAVRTVQRNPKWLNDEAQFAGSFETDKYVYFVFREPAVEYINCGKVSLYSIQNELSVFSRLF